MKALKTYGPCLLVTFALLALSQLTAARAQNVLFTYQGRVTDNGINFNGTGQFKFALVYNTNINQQATAQTTGLVGMLFNLSVTTIIVVNGGSGYVTPPVVTIAPGSDLANVATATATISNGVVTAINVTGGGDGYESYPAVTIAPPPSDFTNLPLWNNDGTTGGVPAATVPVGVTSGLFTVVLGDTNLPNMTAINPALFTEANLLLQIWFNDGVNGFAALSPAQSLTPAPYAIIANSASNLLGTLPTSQLIDPVPANLLTSVPAGSLAGVISQANLGTYNTYTPTIGDGSHNFTTTTQSGYYAKVGNLVYVEIWLIWNSKGSATSTANVEISLPFPVASARADFSPGFMSGFTFTNLRAGGNSGASNILLYNTSSSGGTATDLPVSSCATSGEIQISGFYRWQ